MNTDCSEKPPFHSQFAHFLGTNYTPDKDGMQAIACTLHEPQQKLGALHEQIAQLEETLFKLKAERDSLQKYINEHHALLTPFRRLPVDIIREIFVRCLNPYPTRSMKDAPLLLTTICKSWRQITLETPALWSSIHLFIPELPRHSVDRGSRLVIDQYSDLVKERLAGAERWLKRSGAVPLRLSLSV
ncbi:hypothetical protein L218DRAFT_871799, partial [Marasmius fiardii PR-910]